MKLRAAVIVDNSCIAEWQAAALEECRDLVDIRLILNCTNTRTRKKVVRHFVYYLINLAWIRSRQTLPRPLDALGCETLDFKSRYEGSWQCFPTEVIQAIEEGGVEIVIKFGMSLLRIPDSLRVKHGILSFHHGDPDHYRGRPAGFYELLDGAGSVGVIVQRLSNRLDGGDIYAYARSKVFHWSYRKTVDRFFANSRPLLRKALQNVIEGKVRRNAAAGRNYRLPGNILSIRFILVLLWRSIKRLFYGAFFEKSWRVLLLKNFDFDPGGTENMVFNISAGSVIPVDPRYTFYADPFFSVSGEELYVEAMNRLSGKGDILSVDAVHLTVKRAMLTSHHFSYPHPVLIDDQEYLLPEMADFSNPKLFPAAVAAYSDEVRELRGLEGRRLHDATPFFHRGSHYLFASEQGSSEDNLRLFLSDHIQGPYFEHPASPVVIDPCRARMAGAIVSTSGRLFRFGQDYSREYGDGITVCEIVELTPDAYQEVPLRNIKMGGARGPHTINQHGVDLVLDFYRDRFSPLAGYRRLIAKLSSRGNG